MSKYLHYFETESEFNEQYNGSDYTEPWVSYTKYANGGVKKFRGLDIAGGSGDDIFTYLMAEGGEGIVYLYGANVIEQTISDVSLDGNNDVTSITVNGVVFEFEEEGVDGRACFSNRNGKPWKLVYTMTRNPATGETALYRTNGDYIVVFESNLLKPNDIDLDSSVRVLDILEAERGVEINKPNYNRLMLTIKAGECENSDIFRFVEYTGNTYNRNVKAEDVVKLMARAYNRNGGDTEPTPEPLWNKYVDLYLIKNTSEGPEILGYGTFIWDDETINLTPNEKMDLALNHMTIGVEQTPLNPIILNVNTGKINPEFNDCEIRIARIDVL